MTALKHVDLDKRIEVYPSKLKQGTTWYARFLVEKRELIKGQRYLRESMKTSSEEITKQKALQRYAELNVFQKNDFVIRNITVGEGIKKFMVDFKDKSKQGLNGYSQNMLRLLNEHVVNYWPRYIGHRNPSTITNSDFRNYEGWRKKIL